MINGEEPTVVDGQAPQIAAGDTAVDNHDLAATIAALERIAEDRGVLAGVSDELRARLFEAAGRVAHPGRTARRQLNQVKKQQRRRELAKLKEADERLLAQTALRCGSQSAGSPQQLTQRPQSGEPPRSLSSKLLVPRNCYICKVDYQEVHGFYDALCPACAELNWKKRYQSVDLDGRFALVTGGRVKIGYHTALKLLRAGASVIVTTRFPRDATRRFLAEDDAAEWTRRLQIHGLDMRHVPSVESLADHLVATLPRLDFLLNNACQTVRKPPGFYAHLMDDERIAWAELGEPVKQLLASHHTHTAECNEPTVNLENGSANRLVQDSVSRLVGSQHAAELSQLALIAGDDNASHALFPTGVLDQDQQQVDRREINSWRLRLNEISTVELLEVQMVNAVAPFVLNAKLKPLMTRVSSYDKHIVNVSAMEGIFYRSFKTDKHPHTNMAKAALNMMTRTSAQDYVRDGIHMNSVDTGWITDEDPLHITERKQTEHGFHPPLDCIDAAARICDPIFSGFLTGEHQWGHFWKDYQISKW